MEAVVKNNRTRFDIHRLVTDHCRVCIPITAPLKTDPTTCLSDLVWLVVQNERKCRFPIQLASGFQAHTRNRALSIGFTKNNDLRSLNIRDRKPLVVLGAGTQPRNE